jgi:hypothetical protein
MRRNRTSVTAGNAAASAAKMKIGMYWVGIVVIRAIRMNRALLSLEILTHPSRGAKFSRLSLGRGMTRDG